MRFVFHVRLHVSVDFEIADSHQKGIKEDEFNCFKGKPKGYHVLIRF